MDKIVKIAVPEWENKIIREALSQEFCAETGIEVIPFASLTEAAEGVLQGKAEAMIAGIDYTSREVILTTRDVIGVSAESGTFSASFLLRREIEEQTEEYVIGDAAACKHPIEEQLTDIVMQTYDTAKVLLSREPKVAMLSWSTRGSGGKDEDILKIQRVIETVRSKRPEMKIDGEMQLDAAINQRVAEKKVPESEVAGEANVLILPDLNVGNILYKAMEQFGGFIAAGPILQGFKAPVSDLSRGSTVEDVRLVAEAIRRLALAR